jgi:hypothetical protein
MRCNSAGTSVGVVESCASPGLCNATDGGCEVPECEVNEHSCEGGVLRQCNADRTAFEDVETLRHGGPLRRGVGALRRPRMRRRRAHLCWQRPAGVQR